MEEQSLEEEEVEGHLVAQTGNPRCVCLNFFKFTGYFLCVKFNRSYVCSFGLNECTLNVSPTMLLTLCTGVGGEEATEYRKDE